LTDITSGANTGLWSPDGTSIAFVSTVFPEFSELAFSAANQKNAQLQKSIDDNPVKARTFTKLFYRHWDSYVEDKRHHLFVINADGSNCRNVTPGDRDAYPNSTTFSVGDDFTFTPDSKYLIFAAAPAENEAWSTGYDLCRVSIDNKSTTWESLTKDNPAADNSPRFSPDGKTLAWRSQSRAGYEADKWDITLVAVKPDGTLSGTPFKVTNHVDLSVGEFAWRTPSELAFIAEVSAQSKIHYVGVEANSKVRVEPLKVGSASSLSFAADGKTAAFSHAMMIAPADVWSMRWNENDQLTEAKLSNMNDELLNKIERTQPESVRIAVEGGTTMQMWILKPPGFDPAKKWPVIYLVHGGPQGAWEDGWSYRWNPQLWSAQGYIAVMPNPRGSTGFGQKFVDEISGDWGGKCYRDLVAGLDHVEKLPFVDKERIGTAGASFGGYMMNWFAVNDISARFKCLITHCSVYNFESMWGTTDELWFDEWEHQGLPWEKPGKYAEFSPHKRAGELAKHKTPMLVIHNDYDFRCPIGQGHELFSALQRLKVPSRFVNFPDEGHWVNKPKNSEHWHKEVFAWLTKYVKPGGQ
jgi:dipeptidyl aminopeptidase/acylaminoacyl peptidase